MSANGTKRTCFRTGEKVGPSASRIEQSHGTSGKQARAVNDGLQATR